MKSLGLSIILICLPFRTVFAGIPNYYYELSKSTGVNVTVVFSLALTEAKTPLNNGKVLPWPYTINLNGKAELFLTADAMVKKANYYLNHGIKYFDCGLYQINWKWNGQYRGNNVSDVCRPKENGEIAMQILKEWYLKTGNWIEAAGKYHNPANKNGAADRYKVRFLANMKIAKRMANES